MQTDATFDGVLRDLEKILAAEKTALLGGAYEVVAAATAEKERLGALLERMLVDERRAAQLPAFRKRIKKIIEAAKENEGLLQAAKLGAASARTRIKDILNQQRMVGVYAETGDKVLVPGATITQQKFA